MIYVFGDSHARFNLKHFDLPYCDMHQNSVTMHRIGRDNYIINFNEDYNNSENIFVLFYGEVDCRCHIYRQIILGRNLDEIVEDLVQKYFMAIKNNILNYKKIIIGSITPPVYKDKFESIHGPITHEFPILGTDEERVLYTKSMNKKIKEYCEKYNYTYLDIYDYYSDENGILHFQKSDTICHIQDNSYIHDRLKEMIIN